MGHNAYFWRRQENKEMKCIENLKITPNPGEVKGNGGQS
jgi:hypothetical protein